MEVSNKQINVAQYSDEEVIADVVTGHTAMFEILIRRYNPFLYKIGRSYGFNHQDTEDIMQDTFVNCYFKLKQFAQKSSFKTWLVKIMLHQCFHKAHKAAYKNEMPAEIVESHNTNFMHSNNDNDATTKSVLHKELGKVIEKSLQEIPENYRITFVLRELTGLSITETAELLNTTTSNIKVRLNRAKALLRKEVMKTYSTEEIYEFNLVYCNKIVSGVMDKINASLQDPAKTMHNYL